MSVLTDALSLSLHCDLSTHLDPYQLSRVGKIDLWPDATQNESAAWFLANNLFKKYNDRPRPSKEASNLALAKFLDCNEVNSSFQVKCDTMLEEELINDLSNEIYRFWHPGGDGVLCSSFSQLYERGKLGNGSNRAARDNDLYTKIYDSPLSYTSEDLCFIWQRLSACDQRSLLAEQMRSLRYGSTKVSGNKLSFVNKNVHVARCIATEPTINMWYQLGMAALLEERLKSRYDVSLDIQPDINRAMARIGSLDGSLATIDLESASDLISINFAKRVFPKGMLDWFMLIRSPMCTLPNGKELELHSLSTMGNGFTFPLMTSIFCAVIAVVYRRLGIPLNFGGSQDRNFSVFGDDIIVVTEAVPLLYKLLGLIGFRVNKSKSFVEGPFRESCGADFFQGANVRAVYIKRLSSPQDYAVAINGLNRWTAVTGIKLPTLVGELMRKSRRHGRLLFGPPDEADDACVHVPLDKARFVERKDHGLISYRRWLPTSKRLEINKDTGEITTIGDGERRECNPEGLYLSFLYGCIRGYVITVPNKGPPSYVTRRRVSSSWDVLPSARFAVDAIHCAGGWHTGVRHLNMDDWRRWSDAVRSNLN
jgi:hypothetical protein